MRRFFMTLQFLTRIPIKKEFDIKADDMAKGVASFPFVGLVIGLINLAVFYTAQKLFGKAPVSYTHLRNSLGTGRY